MKTVLVATAALALSAAPALAACPGHVTASAEKKMTVATLDATTTASTQAAAETEEPVTVKPVEEKAE